MGEFFSKLLNVKVILSAQNIVGPFKMFSVFVFLQFTRDES